MFNLFLYLSVNGMLVAIGTKFLQFRSNRCIAAIFSSSISRNTREFFINAILVTTSTFRGNCYSYISTLGHKLTLDIGSTSLFYPEKEKKEKGMEFYSRRFNEKIFEKIFYYFFSVTRSLIRKY